MLSPAALIDEAVALAAAEWVRLRAGNEVPDNLNLRDQAQLLGPSLRKSLLAAFPDLRPANDQVWLLIIARGIEASGQASRRQVEKSLGIILPS